MMRGAGRGRRVAASRRSSRSAAIPPDTLAEDQDLTIAVQRRGWQVTYDQSAIAWTEAPADASASSPGSVSAGPIGTMQCVWKHRRVMANGRPRGLAFLGLAADDFVPARCSRSSRRSSTSRLIVSVIETVTSIHEHGYTAVAGDLQRIAMFWLLFAAIDLTAGLIAFALERAENWRLILWLLPQRFGYRQVMYYVVIKALIQAVRGPLVGWSSVARSGKVELGTRRKRVAP